MNQSRVFALSDVLHITAGLALGYGEAAQKDTLQMLLFGQHRCEDRLMCKMAIYMQYPQLRMRPAPEDRSQKAQHEWFVRQAKLFGQALRLRALRPEEIWDLKRRWLWLSQVH